MPPHPSPTYERLRHYITLYGDGLYSLVGAEELSDIVRDALLEVCHQQQDHLVLAVQGGS
jgi:hypothetical protein